MEFLIKPRFRALNNALYFDTEKLNALVKAEYQDKFEFYQSTFGVFSYMRLNSDMEFVIHYAEGAPLLWQAHNSCAWTPTGTLSMANFSVSPCRVKVNEQYCYDEHFNSTFRSFLEWGVNGSDPTVSLAPAGVEASNELTRTIVKNMTLGARMTMIAGKIHESITVEFEEGVPTRIRQAYDRTANSCRGIIDLLRTRAQDPGLGHLDLSTIMDPNGDGSEISADGKTFTGSGLAVYERLLEAAPDPLSDAIIEGGVRGFDNVFFALMPCSATVYRAVYRDYIAQKDVTAVNEPRISYRPYQWNGTEIKVLFIDETAIVPLREVAHYDQYTTGTSHFAYLTISGVMQLGASFADIPKVNESEVAVMVQVSENAEDYGTHKFLAHALMASAINDTDYICGGFTYALPA